MRDELEARRTSVEVAIDRRAIAIQHPAAREGGNLVFLQATHRTMV